MTTNQYEATYMGDNLTSPYDNAHVRVNTATRPYDTYDDTAVTRPYDTYDDTAATRPYDTYDDTANYGSTQPVPGDLSHTYEYPTHRVPTRSAPACPPPRSRQQVTPNPLKKEKSENKWLTVAFGVTAVIFIAALITVFYLLLTTKSVTQNNIEILGRIKILENETFHLKTAKKKIGPQTTDEVTLPSVPGLGSTLTTKGTQSSEMASRNEENIRKMSENLKTLEKNFTDLTKKMKELVTLTGWYKASDNYYYKLFTSPASYDIAKSRCETLGGRLITKGLEDATVFSELRANVVKTVEGIWIGYNDIRSERHCTWLDGSTGLPAGIVWNTGEPNDSGGIEDCAFIGRIDGSTGVLNDTQCKEKMEYICEKKSSE